MANGPDFSSVGGKPVQSAPIDFSSVGGKPASVSSTAADTSEQSAPSFWEEAGNVLANQAKGAAKSLVAPYTQAYEAYHLARKSGADIPTALAYGGLRSLEAVPGSGGAEAGMRAAAETPERYANYSPVVGKPAAAAYSAAAPIVAPAVGVNLPEMESQAAQGHTAAVAANAAVPAAEAAAGYGASKAAPALDAARQAVAKATVAPLARKPPTATMEDIQFGRGGGAGIVNEGLVAGSRPQLVRQINERIGDLSDAADQQLQNHPNANAQIDVEPIIDKHIDAGIKAAKKVGDQGRQTRLENLRTALKTEYGPLQGTPFEINNLKRDIGEAGSDLGAFKATDPEEASAAKAMGGIYSDIKDAVNAQVPEVAPLNQRMADLISDRMGVKRNIALNANKSPFSVIGVGHAAAKALEATAGSTPVRTGVARVLNAGNVLDVPAGPVRMPSRTAVPRPLLLPSLRPTLSDMQ